MVDSRSTAERADMFKEHDSSFPEHNFDKKNASSHNSGLLSWHSDVLLDTTSASEQHDETWQERESRNALKRVAGLGELQDVTEVEYRNTRKKKKKKKKKRRREEN